MDAMSLKLRYYRFGEAELGDDMLILLACMVVRAAGLQSAHELVRPTVRVVSSARVKIRGGPE